MHTVSAPSSLTDLESRVRRLTTVVRVALVAIVVLAALVVVGLARPKNLRLKTLSIVDDAGVERVRVSGALPDAVIGGQRVPRGDQAAGVLIYDDTGQERGGYVTFSRSRNASLTLDTRKGMVVLLSADSLDGAALRLWGFDFKNWLDLRAGTSGSRLTVGRGDEITLQLPAMSEVEAGAICGEIKNELSQLQVQPPFADVLRACTQHMPESMCRRCLSPP